MWQDLQLQNNSSFQYNLKLLKPSTFQSHLYFLTKKKKKKSFFNTYKFHCEVMAHQCSQSR